MNRRRYYCFAILSGLLICATFSLLYSRPICFTYKDEFTNNKIKILYWNTFFGDENFSFGQGYISKNCPIHNNCFFTYNECIGHEESYDLIIFHGMDKELFSTKLPEKRKPNQKYVFVALESPANKYLPEPSLFDDYFNLTMTYHLDSDIVWSYADVQEIETNEIIVPSKNPKWKNYTGNIRIPEVDKIILNKSKIGAWYVSNCRSKSGREKLFDDLKQYLSVSKFGQCSEENGCKRGDDCFKTVVEPEYFFYFAFENSLCKDYVTEKLFTSLQ